MAFDSHKAVRVSEVRIVIRLYHFFFLPNEAPNLVGLDIFHRNIDDFLCQQPFTLLASGHQELQDGCVVDAGQPLCRVHRASFQQ